MIKANNGQPFAIEIRVAPAANRKKDVPTPLETYRPSQAKVDEGFAFTSIARNQVYGVRLINRAPFAAAVALKIDGLSMFAAATKKGPKGELPFTHLIVEPGENKAFVIKGLYLVRCPLGRFDYNRASINSISNSLVHLPTLSKNDCAIQT